MRLGSASLRRNATLGVGGYAVSATIAFFLAPFIIHTLGTDQYGTWILIAEIGGFYGVLEIGFRSAVSYFVATKLARGEESEIPGLLASAFWPLAAIGVLVLVAGSLLAYAFPILFELEGVSPGDARWAMFLLTVLVALHLPLDTFAAVVNGYRRIDLLQGLDLTVRLLTAGGIVVALTRGGGLVHLASLQLAGKVVSWTATIILARALFPPLSVRRRQFSRGALRTLFSYGSNTFGINVANLLIGRIDLAVIGAFLGVSLNTFYSVGRALADYAGQLCTSLGWSFTMHFADLHGRNSREDLLQLFLRGTRIAALIGLGLAAYVGVFGASFIRLWVGAEFLTGHWTRRSDVILLLFIAALLPRWLQIMSWQLLQGTGRVRFPMLLSMGEAIANLALSLLLVRPLALVGVALGTVVPSLVVHGVILPRYIMREFAIPLPRLLREGYGRAIAVGALCLAFAFAARELIGTSSWPLFFGACVLAGGAGAVACYLVGLTNADREEVRFRIRALLGRPAVASPPSQA